MRNLVHFTFCLSFAFSAFQAHAGDDSTPNRIRVSQPGAAEAENMRHEVREHISFTYQKIDLESVSATDTGMDQLVLKEDDGVAEFTPPPSDEPTGFKAIRGDDPGFNDFQQVGQGSVAYEWMGAYIDNELQNHVVGYAYVINGGGAPQHWNADGYAQTPEDGNLDMSIYTRSFVASVTKQITSVATVKILDAAGLSIDTYIKDYLPAGWAKGNGVNSLKFRHLLTHSTGWGQLWNTLTEEEQEDWNNGWDGLKYVVSLDAAPGSAYSYKNANTALLRVLIPQIWVQMGGAPYTEVTEGNHDLIYLAYVQNNIFEPAGIYNVACWMQSGEEEALAYSFDHADTGGIEHEIHLGEGCGGHAGLRLSAYELAKYLAYLRHSDEIVTLSQLSLINSQALGWDYADDGKYTKSGGWFSTYTVDLGLNESNGLYIDLPLQLNTTFEYQKESRACVAMLPYNVEASLIINSEYEGGGDISPCGILLDAFNFAAN
ncbi:MAG TPA: serine hydrolase [Gammaproteobacteria bacterium]